MATEDVNVDEIRMVALGLRHSGDAQSANAIERLLARLQPSEMEKRLEAALRELQSNLRVAPLDNGTLFFDADFDAFNFIENTLKESTDAAI